MEGHSLKPKPQKSVYSTMKIKIYLTEDGSSSIYNETLAEGYHSRHGAILESRHVFIETGLKFVLQKKDSPISILEMGFGTGLNALLTVLESGLHPVNYTSLELYPLSEEIVLELNYGQNLGNEALFSLLHAAEWEENQVITPLFTIEKRHISLLDFQTEKKFDLVYFDAFAPEIQPELWTEAVFQKLYDSMNEGGVLVTYCAKGIVRRAMKSAGFQVERLPGPPPKREMLRGVK